MRITQTCRTSLHVAAVGLFARATSKARRPTLLLFSVAALLLLGGFSAHYSSPAFASPLLKGRALTLTLGWEPVAPSFDALSLATSSSADVFAGSDFNGVFRSTDDGGSWSNIGLIGFGLVTMAT